jgi:hypothetical protein
VTGRLNALARSLEDRFDDRVTVEVEENAGGRVTRVLPTSDTACIIDWLETSHGLILSAGKQGGRWELPRDLESVAFIEQVVDAVVAGQAKSGSWDGAPVSRCFSPTARGGGLP